MGERGRLFQEALADTDVTIDDQGRRLEARAIPMTDPATIARIDAACLTLPEFDAARPENQPDATSGQ